MKKGFALHEKRPATHYIFPRRNSIVLKPMDLKATSARLDVPSFSSSLPENIMTSIDRLNPYEQMHGKKEISLFLLYAKPS